MDSDDDTTKALMHIQIVCQSNAVAAFDLQNLMLAVPVECCPVNGVCLFITPVEDRLLALMCNA